MHMTDIWADLPKSIKQDLDSQSRTIELKRGDFIYRQGDLPQGLYFVKKGLVGLMMIGEKSGKEHLLRFFRQGQFFGHRALFADEGYHGSTVVLEATTLKIVPKNIIMEVIDKNPILLKKVVTVLSKELRRSENHQVMILENQILVRTAQSLVYLKDLHPNHHWTRQEIANFCASTVSTVIKALAELEKLGMIQQVGRSIEIIDRNALIEFQESESN